MLKEKKFSQVQPEERENISVFSTLKYSKRKMEKEL